jgi:hypothetical protein
MSEYSSKETILVELPVTRSFVSTGGIEYVIADTSGIRIDQDRCLVINEKLVKGMK